MPDSQNSFFIPEGREVKIKLGDQDIFEALKKDTPQLNDVKNPIRLVFTDEISLNLKSQYKNLVETNSSSLLTLLSGVTNGAIPSGQFKLQGLQIWEYTDVLEFSLNVSLYMNTSAKEDVVIPTLALSKLCLPKASTGSGLAGWGLIPPGPDLGTILNLVGASLSKDDKSKFGNRNVGQGLLSIQIGKFLTINNVVMTKVEPTFSNVLDEDFMPVSSSISIDFRTVEIATTQMINDILNFIQKGASTAPISYSAPSTSPVTSPAASPGKAKEDLKTK